MGNSVARNEIDDTEIHQYNYTEHQLDLIKKFDECPFIVRNLENTQYTIFIPFNVNKLIYRHSFVSGMRCDVTDGITLKIYDMTGKTIDEKFEILEEALRYVDEKIIMKLNSLFM